MFLEAHQALAQAEFLRAHQPRKQTAADPR